MQLYIFGNVIKIWGWYLIDQRMVLNCPISWYRQLLWNHLFAAFGCEKTHHDESHQTINPLTLHTESPLQHQQFSRSSQGPLCRPPSSVHRQASPGWSPQCYRRGCRRSGPDCLGKTETPWNLMWLEVSSINLLTLIPVRRSNNIHYIVLCGSIPKLRQCKSLVMDRQFHPIFHWAFY